MSLTHHLQPNLSRSVHYLYFGKWGVWLLFALALAKQPGAVVLCLVLMLCLLLFWALSSWEQSVRRQFIRAAPLPRFLGAKLRAHYPHLSMADVDLVLLGLRQFFMAHLRSKRLFVAMPSKVVDSVWHEFILHTRGYEAWCDNAFGRLLHHTPAEVLGSDARRNNGLRRAWFWACREESINPRWPSRLPLLFALDKKLAIPNGFSYVPDCRDIERQSSTDTHCGTSFSAEGGSVGTDSWGFSDISTGTDSWGDGLGGWWGDGSGDGGGGDAGGGDGCGGGGD